MLPSLDATALDRCRADIEAQLGWGTSDTWTTNDFEELSLRIQEQTGRAISATTLKRLWGRVSYDSTPSRHSLDTLACFVGHASWRAFSAPPASDGAPAATPPVIALPHPRPLDPSPSTPAAEARRVPVAFWFGLSAILLAVAVWLSSRAKSEPAVPVEEIAFQSRPVTSGVPNTVIFEYDVAGVSADSFFIQQSWDQRRRTAVARDPQTYTSIYYRPGFFNAKLLADDRVLAEHPVHVTTEGWIALIDGAPTPTYLTDAFSPLEGVLSVAPSWLQAQGYDLTESYQVLEYYNVQPFGASFRAFALETTLRRTVDLGRYPCGHAEVAVLGERGAIQIPLGNPGCIGEMGLLLGMRYLDGTTNDLSAFGADLSTWQRVRIEAARDTVQIQVGTNPPFTAPFEADIGGVVGLRFRFEGAGAVDVVTLRDADGEVVYDEAF
ncbi:MAG: hypothetical protein AAF730_03770 [Bacteroidota bacterium]